MAPCCPPRRSFAKGEGVNIHIGGNPVFLTVDALEEIRGVWATPRRPEASPRPGNRKSGRIEGRRHRVRSPGSAFHWKPGQDGVSYETTRTRFRQPCGPSSPFKGKGQDDARPVSRGNCHNAVYAALTAPRWDAGDTTSRSGYPRQTEPAAGTNLIRSRLCLAATTDQPKADKRATQ
jgi:hypothetical protein